MSLDLFMYSNIHLYLIGIVWFNFYEYLIPEEVDLWAPIYIVDMVLGSA